MDDRNITFDEIKEKYCNGNNEWSSGGSGQFSLSNNKQSIRVTKLKDGSAEIYLSLKYPSVLGNPHTVDVTELDSTINEWIAQTEQSC